jgi:FkbM family methyltransferase
MIDEQEKQAIIDLFPFMGEKPIVFDVGSNKGHFSDVILNEFLEDCEVHLFEPNRKLLSYTQIKYEYKENVKYHNVGLMNENGRKDFFYFENFNNELSSYYNGGKEWDGLPMNCEETVILRGDTYGNGEINKIDYLKIDCEGADMDALLGFENMLSQDKIGIIQIEYSKHWKRSGYEFPALIDICNKYGYSIYWYEIGNFWKVDTTQEILITPYDNYYITKYEIHNYAISGSNANFILNTSELPKMDLVIEVGTMEGITAKYICENLLNESGRMICVDPLYDYYVTDDPRYHPEFKHQFQRFKRNTRGLPVELWRGESKVMLPELNALRADLVYVDGNHYPDWPYHDLCWAFAITKVGGYILADDYNLWAEGTKASIDKFLDEFNGFYDIVHSNYQILIRKVTNRYNEITQSYYL